MIFRSLWEVLYNNLFIYTYFSSSPFLLFLHELYILFIYLFSFFLFAYGDDGALWRNAYRSEQRESDYQLAAGTTRLGVRRRLSLQVFHEWHSSGQQTLLAPKWTTGIVVYIPHPLFFSAPTLLCLLLSIDFPYVDPQAKDLAEVAEIRLNKNEAPSLSLSLHTLVCFSLNNPDIAQS